MVNMRSAFYGGVIVIVVSVILGALRVRIFDTILTVVGGKVVNTLSFMPPSTTYTSHDQGYAVCESEKGREIPLFVYPAKTTSKKTIIYSHPNAVDLGQQRPIMRKMRAKLPDFNHVSYDFIGYGLARYESPSEQGTYEAMNASIEYVKKEFGASDEDIFLSALSIGSGPAVHFATLPNRNFGGLILQAPFKSCVKVMFFREFWYKFLERFDIFVNFKKIANVNCPVLLIHGKNDHIIKHQHSLDLWEQIPTQFRFKKIILDEGQHYHFGFQRCMGFKKLGKLITDLMNFNPSTSEN